MTVRSTRRATMLAVAAYAAFTAVAFLPVLRDMGGRIVGSNDLDDTTYLWALQWFVHAIGHGQNPFVTDLQFATTGGLNATSFTSIFFPALLVAPVTVVFGPLVSFNVLMIGSPLVAATATFVLLRRVTSDAGAFLGGLVYGFSTFMAVQLLGHLNLVTATALLPVLVAVVAGTRPDRPGGAKLGWGAIVGGLVAGLLYTSSELLMTLTLASLIAVGLAWATGVEIRPVAWCRARRATLFTAAIVAVALCLPFAWFFARGPEVYRGVHQPSGEYQTDLAQVIVPFDVNVFAPAGGITRAVSGKNAQARASGEISPYVIGWTGNEGEWAGYLGVPMLALVAVAAWRRRRVASLHRFAAAAVVTATIASFGATLHVQGADTGVLLPWAVLDVVPIVRSALPARLMVFAFAAAALLVALSFDAVRTTSKPLRDRQAWIASGNRLRLLAVVATIVVLPAVPLTWRPFPADRGVDELLAVPGCAGDRSAVLFLPFDRPSTPLGVQARHDFAFRLARGLGYRASSGEFGPLLLVDGPLLREPRELTPDQFDAARRELDHLGVTCLVVPTAVADNAPEGRSAIRSVAGSNPVAAGDFDVWTAPPAGWSP